MSQSAQSAVKFIISVEIFEKFHQGNKKNTKRNSRCFFFRYVLSDRLPGEKPKRSQFSYSTKIILQWEVKKKILEKHTAAAKYRTESQSFFQYSENPQNFQPF